MKRRVIRGTLILTCSLALWTGFESESDACLFPWMVGHHSGYWGAAYGPYYAPVYRPVYRPVYPPACCPPAQMFYGPACSPCGSVCSPCGPSVYPGGACGVNPQPQPSVTPGKDWKPTETVPKTFSDDQPGAKKKPAPANPNVGNGKASPFDESNDNGQPESPAPTETEVRKPVLPVPPTVIEKKKPAPASLPPEEEGKKDSKNGGSSEKSEKSEKETPKEDVKESGANPQLRIPTLKLDNKITWQSTPKRTRRSLQATFHNPKIVRRSVNPNVKPAPRGTKIAKN